MASSSSSRDEPDADLSRGSSLDLQSLLERLASDIGAIALFSGKELELLSELDSEEWPGFEPAFLKQIQEAADRHLTEKREIRDALGLLKIYHNSQNQTQRHNHQNQQASPSKRKRSSRK